MNYKIKMKENKYIIFAMCLLLLLIGVSFYQYFKEHYGYRDYYYQVKKECTVAENQASQLCSRFSGNKDIHGNEIRYDVILNKYLKTNDPKAKFEKLDAITLTAEIVENTHFSVLQFLSPFLICIAVVGTIHREFQSGIIYQYCTRMKFHVYFKKSMKKIGAIGLMIPVSMILIFLVSMLITGFQFQVAEETKTFAVYFEWKYAHFLFYGVMMCFLQWILSICYGLIAFICCFQNKSKLVSMILGYVFNLIMVLFVNMVIYGLIINKILGMTNLSEYFSLTGYYFFNQPMNYLILASIPVLLLVSIFGYVSVVYGRKSKVLMCYEKQMG